MRGVSCGCVGRHVSANHPPSERDVLTLTVRFLCGFVFGVLLTGFPVMIALDDTGEPRWIYVLAASFLCGLLAALLGDAFWRRLAGLLRWW